MVRIISIYVCLLRSCTVADGHRPPSLQAMGEDEEVPEIALPAAAYKASSKPRVRPTKIHAEYLETTDDFIDDFPMIHLDLDIDTSQLSRNAMLWLNQSWVVVKVTLR